ncbi:MAG: DUF1292 domain-containing protein [Cellulosilyticaceae bacterium]
METEKILFVDETTGEEIEFEVIDELLVDEKRYLLVVDEDDEATILKEISEADDTIEYALVEDENEFQRVTLLFMESDEYDIEV